MPKREPRRKRREPDRADQEFQVEHYRLLFEETVDYAVFHLTLDGTIQTWNPGAARIFGYEASEIVGRPGATLFTPEDNLQGVPEREIKFASETGRAEDSRWHLRKDGSRFWANGVMVGLRDHSGTVVGLGKIVRDDTERKRSDELLQYQLNVADAIATNAAEALFLIDGEGRITFANPIAQTMFGWPQEELLGQFLHEKLDCRAVGHAARSHPRLSPYAGAGLGADHPERGRFLYSQGREPGAHQLFRRSHHVRQHRGRRGDGGAGSDRAKADRGDAAGE